MAGAKISFKNIARNYRKSVFESEARGNLSCNRQNVWPINGGDPNVWRGLSDSNSPHARSSGYVENGDRLLNRIEFQFPGKDQRCLIAHREDIFNQLGEELLTLACIAY